MFYFFIPQFFLICNLSFLHYMLLWPVLPSFDIAACELENNI